VYLKSTWQILSHPPAYAVIPDAILTKIKRYSLGFLTKWASSHEIMLHSVKDLLLSIAFFLYH
jgi:hypothetical protein